MELAAGMARNLSVNEGDWSGNLGRAYSGTATSCHLNFVQYSVGHQDYVGDNLNDILISYVIHPSRI